MAEVESAPMNSEARPLPSEQHSEDDERDLIQQHPTSRKNPLPLLELDTAPSNGTSISLELSPQPQSHEQSPTSEEHGQIREWHDGYRPARRQKKKPRPGESTFRVPMSMEQRKSLGASVRPKEQQAPAITDSQSIDSEASIAAKSPITPATRGGTKLKFRAYAPVPTTISPQNSDGTQLSPSLLSTQQSGMSDQQANHRYPQTTSHINDIDFRSAPLENGPKLAWWLAQQISHVNLWQVQNSTPSQVPEILASQFYGHEASSFDRKRQTDRERKARWREANAEKNRDNDLRARVKKQAKLRFGEEETVEMNNWITAEVAKRKARRVDRQISQAAKSGRLPSFANSENIRSSLLRESLSYTLRPAVYQLKRQIVDVLFPSQDGADTQHRHAMIHSVTETINRRQSQDEDSLRAAFTSIAQDELAFNGIRSLMVQFETEDDEEADHEGLPPTRALGETPNTDQTQPVSSDQVFKTLNEALAILTELKDLGDKQQAAGTKIGGLNGSVRTPSAREQRQYLKDFGMSELQFEDFLVLVNGGPLEPDPDDDIAVELYGNDLDVVPIAQVAKINIYPSDSETWSTINSVLEALLGRCISPPRRGRRSRKVIMDENHAKNQAAKVKALLTELEIGGNRVRSRMESQAISEFYARLTNFSKTQSFGGPLSQIRSQQQQATSPTHATSDTASGAGTKRKRKHSDESASISQSPGAAMPLPNATNPFADDVVVVPPSSTSKSAPSPMTGVEYTSNKSQPIHSPTTIRQTLPPSAPMEPQMRTYSGYPQFRHVQSSEQFRS